MKKIISYFYTITVQVIIVIFLPIWIGLLCPTFNKALEMPATVLLPFRLHAFTTVAITRSNFCCALNNRAQFYCDLPSRKGFGVSRNLLWQELVGPPPLPKKKRKEEKKRKNAIIARVLSTDSKCSKCDMLKIGGKKVTMTWNHFCESW